MTDDWLAGGDNGETPGHRTPGETGDCGIGGRLNLIKLLSWTRLRLTKPGKMVILGSGGGDGSKTK